MLLSGAANGEFNNKIYLLRSLNNLSALLTVEK